MRWKAMLVKCGFFFTTMTSGNVIGENLITQSSSLDTQASYVGSDACVDCHQEQSKSWQGSHHDMAMKHADEKSVLGNFEQQTVEFRGQNNRFFRLGNEYWVNIQGPDGQFHDYQIRYTFGWEPLQQYMVEFDDGRVQLIPYAWDSRPKDEGGQRWFDLYPDTSPTDEFYWTNSGQNWNFMCADCHSTNLQKNYNTKTDTYNSQWAEINVGCEACHGPASHHVQLAKQQSKGALEPIPEHYGFSRELSQAVKQWVGELGSTSLQPHAIRSTDQLQVCAQCHSRRTQLNETQDHVSGSFFDKYRLSLITQELYHHDGQIYDENYVYGSFLQSKMAKKGVTCTNCHDPHTAKLKMPEQQLCAQCHLASEYTPEKHTFHLADSKASQCTTCHMPETTYMQIDPRRDHSWHVPRADISQHIKTPNVCTGCHQDKTERWADEHIGKWFPNSPYRNQQHFGVAFYADSISHANAPDALAYLAQDSSLSDIIRGSALERMEGNTGRNTLIALARAVKHDSELIRIGAIEGSSGYEFNDRWQILQPLLTDPVLSIRAEAAAALVTHYQQMSREQKSQLSNALNDYIAIQEFNSDRGFGLVNLANVYRSLGHLNKAEALYQRAIEIEPYFANSYVNLADLYRVQGKDSLAISKLQIGIQAQPKSSALPYSLGLALLRNNQSKQAKPYLRQAAQQASDNPQYWYVYGLALENTDVMAASEALQRAFLASRNPRHLYAQCEVLARNIKLRRSQPVTQAFESCLKTLGEFVPPEVVQQLRTQAQ